MARAERRQEKDGKRTEHRRYTQEEAAQIRAIGPILADWYEKNGRELPWRTGRDAYRIWISEIMLQQTRIEAVKPYFARFMEILPTLSDLALVEEDRLMKLWEGLGYYSRARNLKKCAMEVMEQHGGQLPADYEALKKLPGIGPYTAGAIGSLAYGLAVPAVDGNVLRVLSRIMCSYEDIMQTGLRKKMEQLLLDHMPQDRPGAFNEGIMELGETICIPNGRPLCENCPLRECCLAYKAGVQEQLPVKAPKKTRRVEEKTVLVLRYAPEEGEQKAAGQEASGEKTAETSSVWIALRKRPDSGLLAGLYELPWLDESRSPEQWRRCLPEMLAVCGLYPLSIRETGKARHIFTHVEWDMTGYVVELKGLPGTLAESGMKETSEQAGNMLQYEGAMPTASSGSGRSLLSEELIFVERRALERDYALPTAFKAFRKWL